MAEPHLFTIIMDTYYRPALLKQAVNALFRQTYQNLEIIVVNNGATPETVEYLYEIESLDQRVRLVHFEQNLFDPNDPIKMVDDLLNTPLQMASGDYVWYQADDDLIADDYAEKMVVLFKENSECTTAAGLPVPIDAQGRLMDMGPRRTNFRPRYMPGHLLALNVLRGGAAMFGAPGTIFTIRRDALIEAGGYHGALEQSQLYGIVPFGVTGFDETAVFYWRYSEGQLSRQNTATGRIGIRHTFTLLKDWEIERRWGTFGEEVAREVVSAVGKQSSTHAAFWFVANSNAWRLWASLRIIRRAWNHPHFWAKVFTHGTKSLLSLQPVRSLVRPLVKGMFRCWPRVSNISSSFAKLRERVNR